MIDVGFYRDVFRGRLVAYSYAPSMPKILDDPVFQSGGPYPLELFLFMFADPRSLMPSKRGGCDWVLGKYGMDPGCDGYFGVAKGGEFVVAPTIAEEVAVADSFASGMLCVAAFQRALVSVQEGRNERVVAAEMRQRLVSSLGREYVDDNNLWFVLAEEVEELLWSP